MSVHNSATTLNATIKSVLGQQGIDLEFIVVDDGSSDGTRTLLENFEGSDDRLRVVYQENRGLTLALERGCALATGCYIARQDAGGDISLPDRFRRQAACLDARPDAVMVSCATEFVGPDGEHLFDAVLEEGDLASGLSTLAIPGVRGPSHHGATMFRRDAYLRVGGYRRAFVVAQDMDLWLRLFEVGACLAVPEVLYQARLAPGTISSRLHGRQLAFGSAAVECARSRRSGQAEPPFPLPDQSWSVVDGGSHPHEAANLHYFLGSCLQRRDPAKARAHFLKSIFRRPMHVKTWIQLFRSFIN